MMRSPLLCRLPLPFPLDFEAATTSIRPNAMHSHCTTTGLTVDGLPRSVPVAPLHTIEFASSSRNPRALQSCHSEPPPPNRRATAIATMPCPCLQFTLRSRCISDSSWPPRVTRLGGK
ncbi:hypothetical protein BS78_02G125700 [Paspalum vaginatum]|nr:hypothetical protein BS78_02G125700 [Paspalum vaginatum]